MGGAYNHPAHTFNEICAHVQIAGSVWTGAHIIFGRIRRVASCFNIAATKAFMVLIHPLFDFRGAILFLRPTSSVMCFLGRCTVARASSS